MAVIQPPASPTAYPCVRLDKVQQMLGCGPETRASRVNETNLAQNGRVARCQRVHKFRAQHNLRHLKKNKEIREKKKKGKERRKKETERKRQKKEKEKKERRVRGGGGGGRAGGEEAEKESEEEGRTEESEGRNISKCYVTSRMLPAPPPLHFHSSFIHKPESCFRHASGPSIVESSGCKTRGSTRTW